MANAALGTNTSQKSLLFHPDELEKCVKYVYKNLYPHLISSTFQQKVLQRVEERNPSWLEKVIKAFTVGRYNLGNPIENKLTFETQVERTIVDGDFAASFSGFERNMMFKELYAIEDWCGKNDSYLQADSQTSSLPFLALFGASAATAFVIHYLAKEKIANPYKRAAVSIAISSAAVLAGYTLA